MSGKKFGGLYPDTSDETPLAQVVGVIAGLASSSFVGYSIYKYVMKKTGNKAHATTFGVLSGLGTAFAPPSFKFMAVVGSTAAIASTL